MGHMGILLYVIYPKPYSRYLRGDRISCKGRSPEPPSDQYSIAKIYGLCSGLSEFLVSFWVGYIKGHIELGARKGDQNFDDLPYSPYVDIVTIPGWEGHLATMVY